MRRVPTPSETELALPEIWVVDSSPFIGLAKIGCLGLLTAPGRDVVIPEAVIREVEAGPDDPAREAISAGWGRRLPSVPIPPELAAWRLGAGEEAVLALSLVLPGALAIVDDGDGRRAARAIGVAVAGTTGVLVRARQAGQIEALTPLLLALRAVGVFLPPDDILQQTLQSFGETWPPQ